LAASSGITRSGVDRYRPSSCHGIAGNDGTRRMTRAANLPPGGARRQYQFVGKDRGCRNPAATSALRSFVSPERRFTVLVGHLLADLGVLGAQLEPPLDAAPMCTENSNPDVMIMIVNPQINGHRR
jgi:hypothetical protein